LSIHKKTSNSGSRRIVEAQKTAEPDPEWGVAAPSVARWPALAAILVAIALYITLPDKLVYGPRWLLPLAEAAVLFPLLISRGSDRVQGASWQRWSTLALVAIINLANIGSLLLLIHGILMGQTLHHHKIDAQELITTSAQIWLTNVIVFALWYWELDRGGPGQRSSPRHREPDFLFPQMANPRAAPKPWTPSFVDYLYLSFTNATAFSPTDTMPLTEWSKLLMMVQAMASLLTVALVAARAVNILGR
jgi:uncharacterized membrane protein